MHRVEVESVLRLHLCVGTREAKWVKLGCVLEKCMIVGFVCFEECMILVLGAGLSRQ
jgi:hypothetical protein